MQIDRRYCFVCDTFLGDTPMTGSRLPHCARCRSELDAYQQARASAPGDPPAYRHTVALGTSLDGWPTAVALVSLDVWDQFLVLHCIERPGNDDPTLSPRLVATSRPLGDMPARAWTITTDQGTAHHSGGGGGGTPGTDAILAWEATLAPTLPDSTTSLRFDARAPGVEGHAEVTLDTPAPSTATLAAQMADPGLPDCPACGPPPPAPPEARPAEAIALDWAIEAPPEPEPAPPPDNRRMCAGCVAHRDRVLAAKQPTSPMPDRILALSARFPGAFGTDLVATALTVWPTWFDISLVGPMTGAWQRLACSEPWRAITWHAHDDRGNRYLGTVTGSTGGDGLYSQDLTFSPALAPTATAVTLTSPPTIDGTTTTATITLPTSPPVV